ncbi:SxtJ family membrane protein [Primorskyibacter sp. S87]|uniref:SxtJ family membrane protein n=1 Tax=Primorskyibacter sp. S87 TaxID=3415126 RepID=UPI003C7C015E
MAVDKATIDVKMGSERSFGFVFAAVFAIIAIYPVLHGNPLRVWALGISAVFLAITFLRPQVFATPNRLWFKFGLLLGAIVSPIVMAGVFFLVVTPIGLVMSLFRKDPLGTHPDPEAQSYWVQRETPLQPFQRQF